MPKNNRRVRIFSALEVANICGVVNQTIINWIRSGHLKAFTTPGGQYRVYAKDLAAFLDTRGMNASGEVLHVIMENANWDTVVIGAEQPLNDTLKAGIRKSFPDLEVVQAHDWFEIGRRITEKKPGFILIDTALEGVEIDTFISSVKEDTVFGIPAIFLLAESKRVESYSAYGADVVLSKPLDMGKLKAAINNFERQMLSASTA